MERDDFEWKSSKINKSIFEDKYSLVFETKINILNEEFNIFTYSRPILLLTQTNQEIAAYESILWDSAFTSINRVPFEIKQSVQWTDLKRAMFALFKELLNRELSEINIEFLFNKMTENLSNEEKHDLWMDKIHVDLIKHLKRVNSNYSESFTFLTWFITSMVTMKKNFPKGWEQNLIFGYITKVDAANIILRYANDTPGFCILRFSETSLGRLSLAFSKNTNNGVVVDHTMVPEISSEIPLKRSLINTKFVHTIIGTDRLKDKKEASFHENETIEINNNTKGTKGYVGMNMEVVYDI